MALENANYISGLNSSNPAADDPISQGDDHIRTLKKVLLQSFPDVDGPVSPPAAPTSANSTLRSNGSEWVESKGVTITSSNELSASKVSSGDVDAAGTVSANKVTAPTYEGGNMSLTGNVTANKYFGDGSALINLPESVDAYTKTESDNKYQPKGNYQPKGDYALVGDCYTKSETDNKYQLKGNYALVGASYTKSESDNNYQPKGSYALSGDSYTKSQSDSKYQSKGNYALVGASYTKSESDLKYALKGDVGGGGPTYSAGNGISINNAVIQMTGSYNGSFSATGNITAYSDDRLKTRLGEVEDALSKVKQIETFRYVANEEGEKHGMGVSEQMGVSAQQLQSIAPEAVHETDTGHLSVDYGRLVVLCIEAIKQLEAR